MILINGQDFSEFKDKAKDPKSNEAKLVLHIEEALKTIRGKQKNIIFDPHPSRIRYTKDETGQTIPEHSNGRTDKNSAPFNFNGMVYMISWIKGFNPKDKKGNVRYEAVDYTGGVMQFDPKRNTEEIFYRVCVLKMCGVSDKFSKYQQERSSRVEYIIRDREADAKAETIIEEYKAFFYNKIYGSIDVGKEDIMIYARALGIKNIESISEDMLKAAIKKRIFKDNGSVNLENFQVFKDAAEEDTRANDAVVIRQAIVDNLIILDVTGSGKKAYYSVNKGEKDKYIMTVDEADDYEEALIDWVGKSSGQRDKLFTYLKGEGKVLYAGSKGGSRGNIDIKED